VTYEARTGKGLMNKVPARCLDRLFYSEFAATNKYRDLLIDNEQANAFVSYENKLRQALRSAEVEENFYG
jgi:hypothetical protein